MEGVVLPRVYACGRTSGGVTSKMETMLAFGPVPSRRLGRSLGINNIPPKVCTYSCVYCQLGRTLRLQARRGRFYEPAQILDTVRDKVARAKAAGHVIDYLAFVPDGEPTLDVRLGQEIMFLKSLGLPMAVISNASLIGQQEVRDDLMKADWVSLKVDAVENETWRSISRPHGSLNLTSTLQGGLRFAQAYGGKLVTETMLVAGVNDSEEHLRALSSYLADLQPSTAYLSIPTRPPAEEWVRAPDERTLARAYQIICEKVGDVETLFGYEGNAFAFTGNAEKDLLAITAVHPMREDAVMDYLTRAGAGWSAVRRLMAEGKLVKIEYGSHIFYLRRLRAPDTIAGAG